ncbi:hypothetical protein E4U53_006318 [Claviceps sorghi]|nr:hypothetical protein E4U53_006318 [Claviceps sorghi]
MAFSSARGNKVVENEKTSRDTDVQGRVGIRSRGDTEGDRFREGRSNPLRRRGEGEQDGDGWNMVKPRKSFGAEGAERFHGKMGGNFRDEKRSTRDSNKDERESARERPGRVLDILTRDRDGPDAEARPRNGGPGRNKGDNWRATDAGDAPAPEKRDRDRMKSWRDRDRDAAEPSDDRGAGRTNDRRWGRERDQRQEREPEWLDEPAEVREAHTQQDFQKWMEQMKKAKSASSTSTTKPPPKEPVAEAATAKPSLPTSSVETGPDKFFLAFGGASAATDVTSPGEPKDSAPKAKASGKSSRFTSFFSQPPADSKPRTESSTPLTGPPTSESAAAAGSATVPPGLGALFGAAASSAGGSGGGSNGTSGAPPDEERQAFKQLLAKLQKASMSATPPGPSPFAAPPPGNGPELMTMSKKKKNAVGSPVPLQQYGGAAGEVSLGRPPSQQPQQEILAPRPQQHSARPEQLLQDLVGHHQRVSSQGSTSRPDPHSARNNSNTEFLMNLMRMAPDSQRGVHNRVPSQPQLGPQVQKHSGLQSYHDREQQDFGGRENRNNMRPQPPPGFPMDEPFHNVERESRQNQPTQILQRPPPPPGLDQMPPAWMAGGAQMPPPQQRGPMLPPPGLAGGLGASGRNMPMPPMFPPNFPPGAMLPPDAMGGMPPRNMPPPPPPPPPGFFNGPPHGFLPPGLGGFNGPPLGPEGFGAPPFEARGMPPSASNNGRGINYGRL